MKKTSSLLVTTSFICGMTMNHLLHNIMDNYYSTKTTTPSSQQQPRSLFSLRHDHNDNDDNNTHKATTSAIADLTANHSTTTLLLVTADDDHHEQEEQDDLDDEDRNGGVFDNEEDIHNPPLTNNFSGIIARAYEPWIHTSLPCYPPENDWKKLVVQDSPADTGFLYLKPYKTGSSTTSGINIRIARNVAIRKQKQQQKHRRQQQEGNNNTNTGTTASSITTESYDVCRSRFQHGPYNDPSYSMFHERIKDKSYLWTIIREPTKRVTSMFFHFEVSRNKLEPSDANFKKFLFDTETRHLKQDYYLHSLSTTKRYEHGYDDPVLIANDILNEYNFIGITERMDESAVVLMMLLNLRIADILYLSAKSGGNYDDAGGRSNKDICTYIWPSFISPGMNKVFAGDRWQNEYVQYDLALYHAANRSLDLTIKSLGRDKFNDNLSKFRNAQSVVHERCSDIAVFPCTVGGYRISDDKTGCLWKDSGCGTKCLDQIATDLNLW